MIVEIEQDLTCVRHTLVPRGSFSYAFFGRRGGVSPAPYASLNTCLQSGDDERNISRNIELIARKVNLGVEDMYFARQQHTNNVVVVENECSVQNAVADGLVTGLKNKALCINSSDGVPVILVDPVNKVAGIAHADWRGQADGVIQNTLSALLGIGADINSVLMIIGPCMRKSSYKVNKDVFQIFTSGDVGAEDFFYGLGDDDALRIDLVGYACNVAMRAGVKNIYDCCIDTFTDDNFFSSYRAKCEGHERCGGNMSLVVLNENDR